MESSIAQLTSNEILDIVDGASMTNVRQQLIRLGLIGLVSTVALAATTAIATLRPKSTVQVFGEQQSIGDGTLRTFATLDDKNNPMAIGVAFTEASLSDLPTFPIEYELSLPSEASAYRYVVLSWNPQGHAPAGTYDVPHFDFHFYTLSAAERQKITAVGEDLARVSRAPSPEFMPDGYVLEPTAPAPREGRHWIDSNSSEFQGLPFTQTFIYGTYDGEIVFAEPMLTKAFLETKPTVRESISLPSAYTQTAYYPTHYSVNYDSVQRTYTVSLDGLTLRSGSKP